MSSLLVLTLVCLLMGTAYLAQGDSGTKGQPSPDPDSSAGVRPGFTVYSLKELSRTEGSGQTTIRFDPSALPFEFGSLIFKDYTTNPVLGATYYAGSGMVVNATGMNGNVTLREPGGTVIHSVQYLGQSSIVFNGETVYTSTTRTTTRYEGTDILVQDWLKGTWSPEKGVILERPTGMTIEESELFLMVFQPQATVPEFGLIPAVAAMLAVSVIIWRARATRG